MTRFGMQPWLSIIGLGEDGFEGLSLAARDRLAQARLVVGGARHLALVGPLAAETMAWPSPLGDGIAAVLARRGTPVCVLASGDPFFFGVGSLLAADLDPDEFLSFPAPSSFSLAAGRLGWPLQTCRLLSLHGRELRRIVPELQPRARLLALSWDATTPARVAAVLGERGFGASSIKVMEALGGPRERIRTATADGFAIDSVDPLNIIGIEVAAATGAQVVPLGAGRSNAWFEHDGQITRPEIRAMVLAALRPFRGGVLWDVGAGSGSVAIEWMLLDPQNRATAVEADEARAARAARNASALGVSGLEIVCGRAPDALKGLARPDAVFIGGGATDHVIAACHAALAPGGRLVANAVTIETQARLIAHHERLGGDLTQIALAHADPVGRLHGWRPAMPITQWAVTKAARA